MNSKRYDLWVKSHRIERNDFDIADVVMAHVLSFLVSQAQNPACPLCKSFHASHNTPPTYKSMPGSFTIIIRVFIRAVTRL